MILIARAESILLSAGGAESIILSSGGAKQQSTKSCSGKPSNKGGGRGDSGGGNRFDIGSGVDGCSDNSNSDGDGDSGDDDHAESIMLSVGSAEVSYSQRHL